MRKLPLIIALAFISCVNDPTSLTAYPTADETLAEVVRFTARQVEDLRGLPFLREVTPTLTTPRQQRSDYDSIYDGYAEEYTFWQRLYVQLGLLRARDTVRSAAEIEKDYFASFAAAFYRPGTDTITIVLPEESPEVLDSFMATPGFKPLIAHELVHALQDQHYGAWNNADIPEEQWTTDYWHAQRALVEGDADFTESLYWYRHVYALSDWDVRAAAWARFRRENFCPQFVVEDPTVPPYVRIPSVAPYLLGPDYIARTYDRGGWPLVAELFTNRPTTTAEFVVVDFPADLDALPFDGVLPLLEPADSLLMWTKDVLGAVEVQSFLVPFRGLPEAAGICEANGWRGDRLFYSWIPGTDAGTLVWALSFSSDSHARDFASLLDTLVVDSRGYFARPAAAGRTGVDTSNAPVRIVDYTSPSIGTTVVLNGRRVWWIENAGTHRDALVEIATNGAAAKQVHPRLLRARNPLSAPRRHRRVP